MRKRGKYSHLETSHHFTPVAVESLGALGPDAQSFLQDMGQHLREATSEPSSYHYLLQRISVAMQHGKVNTVLGTQGDLELAADPIFLFNLFALESSCCIILLIVNSCCFRLTSLCACISLMFEFIIILFYYVMSLY